MIDNNITNYLFRQRKVITEARLLLENQRLRELNRELVETLLTAYALFDSCERLEFLSKADAVLAKVEAEKW